MLGDQQGSSTRPYLLRALYEWCGDNGFTPYVAVHVDNSTQVPTEFVRDGEIVLNISMSATDGLSMGNEWIEFQARFGGVARQIAFPVSHVIAIYAKETGQGMAFPAPAAGVNEPPKPSDEPQDPPPRPAGGHLKRVK